VAGTKLSPDLYRKLQNVAIPMFKAKDSTLFQAGQPAEGAFLVRSGRVRMSLDHAPLYPTRSIGPGNVIGLPATFSGEPYSLTAKAERNCRLDFIPRERLLDLLQCNPEVGFHVVRVLSEEIFQMRKAARAMPRRTKSRLKRKGRNASVHRQ
jgi:CRP-like cAMP-binding protein